MDDKYIEEGYKLMTTYITEQRIKTKNRKFLNRLEKFYKRYQESSVLSVTDEQEYLRLEKEFYTIILPEPDNNEDKANLEFLKMVSRVDINEE